MIDSLLFGLKILRGWKKTQLFRGEIAPNGANLRSGQRDCKLYVEAAKKFIKEFNGCSMFLVPEGNINIWVEGQLVCNAHYQHIYICANIIDFKVTRHDGSSSSNALILINTNPSIL